MKQGSEEWLQWRREHITASNVAAIMGEDPWRTPLDVYLEMVEDTGKEKTAAMERGTRLEPFARRAYEEYTGIAIDDLVLEHPSYPWLGASLDGISFNRDYVVEIKCPGEKSYLKMKANGIPRHYWIQVQTQLLCVPEAKEAHFFVCQFKETVHEDGYGFFEVEDYFMETIKRDTDFQYKELMPICEKFYTDNVCRKVAPPAKYFPIETQRYIDTESRLQKLMDIKKKIEIEEEELKQVLIEEAQGRSVQGLLTRVCTQTRKGSICEEKLRERGLNVDALRKPNKVYQSVNFIKRKEE